MRKMLEMLGAKTDGFTMMYKNKPRVTINNTNPNCTFKKKHNALAYYKSREVMQLEFLTSSLFKVKSIWLIFMLRYFHESISTL